MNVHVCDIACRCHSHSVLTEQGVFAATPFVHLMCRQGSRIHTHTRTLFAETCAGQLQAGQKMASILSDSFLALTTWLSHWWWSVETSCQTSPFRQWRLYMSLLDFSLLTYSIVPRCLFSMARAANGCCSTSPGYHKSMPDLRSVFRKLSTLLDVSTSCEGQKSGLAEFLERYHPLNPTDVSLRGLCPFTFVSDNKK